MKFTWEEKDIQPGVRYGRPDIKEVWMISWFSSEDDPELRWTSVSLTDGMICAAASKETITSYLNSAGYIPLKFMEGMK